MLPATRRPRSLLLAALLAALVAACGDARERAAVHLDRARVHLEAGSLEKARLEFQNVLQIDPGHVQARLGLGGVLERLERWRPATGHYLRVLDLEPYNTRAKTRLARIYVLARAPHRALPLVDEVLEIDPGHREARRVRAAARAMAGDSVAATADLAAVLALDAGDVDARVMSALLHLGSGQPEAAEHELRRGLEHAPDSVPLRLVLSRALLARGALPEAVRQMEVVVARTPATLAYRTRLAALYARVGRSDDGESLLRAAAQAEVDGTGAQGNEARLALLRWLAANRGREAAHEEMKGLVAADPDDHALAIAVADLHVQRGQPAEAERLYRQLVEAADGSPEAIAARTGLATLLLNSGRAEEAGQVAARVLGEVPSNVPALMVRAAVALARGDPAAAIADCRTVLHQNPRDSRALRLKARAHVENGEIDQAHEDLLRLLDLTPADVAARLAHLDLLAREAAANGNRKRLEGSLADALERAETLLEHDHESVEGLLLRGRVHLAEGDAMAAGSAFEAALSRDADSLIALGLLARARAAAPGAEAARERLRQILAADPADVQARLLLADAVLRGGNPEETRHVLEQGTALDPEHPGLLAALARVHAASHDPQAAHAIAERMVARSPGRPDGYLLAGDLHLGGGDPEQALQAYEAARVRAPRAIEPLVGVARSHFAAGRPAAAEADLLDLLAREPEDAAVLNLLGEVRLARGRPAEAETAFRQALAVRPHWTQASRNLARARLAGGDAAGAIAHLDEALELDSDGVSTGLDVDLAALYEHIGEHGKAIAHYEKLLREQPGNDAVANNLAMLLADHRTDAYSLQRALLIAARFRGSASLPYLDTLGWVHLRRGEVAQAVAILRAVVDAAPTVPEFNYHLGKALQAAGDLQRAEHHLRTALASGRSFPRIDEARSALAGLQGSR